MKKLLALALAMAMALSLTACGGDGDTSGGNTSGGNTSADTSSTIDPSEVALTTEITSTDQITIRIAHDTSEQHPSHIVLEEAFKAPLEAASNGNITVEIYPNSMLGSLTENFNSIQMGDLEMAYLNDSIISGFIPEFNVVGLPYLFTSVDNAHEALLGEFGDELSQMLYDQQGLINLGWCDVGFRNLTNSKHPITSVADLSGLKIRTQTNDVHVAYFDALGALPTPMSFNELYSALQQKTVDGQENPTAMIWNNNIWEVQPYMTVSEHVWTATTLCIGAEFFEGLPEDYQAAIQEAADNTTRLQREMITQENEELLQNIIDGGVEVVELTDEAKQEFIDIAQESVYPQAAQDYGQELIDLALSYNGAAGTSGGDTGDADTSSASTPGSDVSASTSSSAA